MAEEVLGRDVVAALLEELAAGSDPHALLLRAVQLRGAELDPLVSAAVVALGHPRARVSPLAAELGVSARQLHRRVRDAVGYALAAALHAGGVTDDAGLDRATDWCWRSIETTEQPGGYWLKYACAFLDAAPDEQRALAAIASLTARVDTYAGAPVGGVEAEALRPLDLSPLPRSRSRGLFTDDQLEAHLDAVESEQQPDGGWMFDWLGWSPAQTTDWRGNVTLRALIWLRDNGRI